MATQFRPAAEFPQHPPYAAANPAVVWIGVLEAQQLVQPSQLSG
jgi:hypothetical protein